MKKLIVAWGKIVAVLFTVLFSSSAHALTPVPDTGQTKCYNASGEITCPSPGQAFYGQDATYAINPPSFTKLGLNGAVLPDTATYADGWLMTRDNVTGLVWENKEAMDGAKDYFKHHDADNTYTWCDTNPATNGGNQGTCSTNGQDSMDIIEILNLEHHGGYADWRLPTVDELRTIANYSQADTTIAIDLSYFPNTANAAFWTSSTYSGSSTRAWVIHSIGVDDVLSKSGGYRVRAVRGGQPRPLDRFTLHGDGTVTDRNTGLMWQQQDDGVRRDWQSALAYAEDSPLADYSDWRLPTIKELATITSQSRLNPAIDPNVFPNTKSFEYWSSTTYQHDPGFAWFVNFNLGNGGFISSIKSNINYVRLVRGNPANPLEISSLAPATGSSSGGTAVTITGIGFGTSQGSGSVAFGGAAATISSWSATQIVCTPPAHAIGTVDVMVTADDQRAAKSMAGFTYFTSTTVPEAPSNASAVPGDAMATVTFTEPAADGGSAITGYTVTSTPGGFTATGTGSPLKVSGLANGTSYQFGVVAHNTIGPGATSNLSTPVTPIASSSDADLDGIRDTVDKCPFTADPAQLDTDLDGIGDACDGTTASAATIDTGSGVTAAPVNANATLTFAGVVQAGQVIVTEIAPPASPAGLQFLPGNAYDIHFTGVQVGPVTVCFQYADTDLPVGAIESELTLLHGDNGQWIDITTSRDAVGNEICGQASSLSPFVLAAPQAADTTAPEITTFTLPAASASPTVAITALEATDAVGVSQWCLSETDSSAGCIWLDNKPDGYYFAGITEGVATEKALYAWARDAAGNVSLSALASTTITVPVITLDTGLVAYYPFNGNANDESGNGNHGTVNGATLTEDRLGNSNTAYSFNAAGNHIGIPISSEAFSAEYTVSVWVLFRDFSNNYPHILSGQNNFIAFHGLGPAYANLPEWGANRAGFYQESTLGAQKPIVPSIITSQISTNTFHQITITKNNSTASIYLDGVLQDSIAVSTTLTPDTGNSIKIGTHFENSGPDESLHGSVDDVRIYNRALSTAEVQALHSLQPPDTTAPEITAFTIPAASTSATVAITGLDASDAVGQWCLSETDSSTGCTWVDSKPADYTFTGIPKGVATGKTLFAWAKDAAGNVSASASASTTITLPVITLTTGLVAYYPLNNNADDASGNGNNATVVGSVPFQPSPFATAPKFSSRDTYLFANTPGMGVNGWKEITISAWVKMDGYTTYGTVVDRAASGTASSYHLQIGGTYGGKWYQGSFSVCFSPTFGDEEGIVPKTFATGTTPYPPRQTWYHLVGTYDGQYVRYYVNGVLDGEKQVSAAHVGAAIHDSANTTTRIGNSASAPTWYDQYVNGQIDEVRIYNRALSSAEIQALADTTAPVITAFSLPAASMSATVTITDLAASDAVGVTQWCLTETNSNAGCVWGDTKPVDYAFTGIPEGVATGKTLFAWARDTAGNVSTPVRSNTNITLPDAIAPEITAFTLPAASSSATVAISDLAATDAVGVSQWCVSETDTNTDCMWLDAKPNAYAFADIPTGVATGKTLHAWARDAAGNVSLPANASTTITLPAIPPATITVPTDSANGSYQVNWQASATPGATYVLEEATDSGFTTNVQTLDTGVETSASIHKTTLDTGATFYYRVKATTSSNAASDWTTAANGCLVQFPVVSAPGAVPLPVPDSGQTKCYNDSGEIPCPQPGEPFYGQDGNYTINPPSYTKLDANGHDLPYAATSWPMVRDNVTGLIWENKDARNGSKDYANPHDADNTYTWCDTNPATNGGHAGTCNDGQDTEDFIKAMNDANYGGHNDWRMPTVEELRSIRDYGKVGQPSHPAFFTGSGSDETLWASLLDAGGSSNPWFIFGASDRYLPSTFQAKAYAVRGGGARAADHWTPNNDDTVTDTDTGLMWQQPTAPGTYTWQSAQAYCDGLEAGGHTDWRLPNLKELASIVDYTRTQPAIDTTIFPDTRQGNYRSSTSVSQFNDLAWRVDFRDGSSNYYYKSSESYVRCVRSLNSSPASTLAIPPFSAKGSAYQVSWPTSDTPGVTYVIEEATDSAFTSIVQTLESTVPYLALTKSEADRGTTFYYRVKATKVGHIDSAWLTGANGCLVGVPLAKAGADQTVFAGTTVRLDGSASQSATSYLWTIRTWPSGVAGSIFGQKTTVNPSFTPTVPGTYVIELETANEYGGSLPDTVAITVVPRPNRPPVITQGDAALTVSMSEDSVPTPFALTLNATDEDADPLSWQLGSAALRGTTTVDGAGPSPAIAYTPAPNFHGSDSFSVEVGDGKGGTDRITVNVSINNPEYDAMKQERDTLQQRYDTDMAALQGRLDTVTFSFFYGDFDQDYDVDGDDLSWFSGNFGAVLNSDDDGDGVSELEGDCNDHDPTVSPEAAESCGDGIDNNCEGQVDETCP